MVLEPASLWEPLRKDAINDLDDIHGCCLHGLVSSVELPSAVSGAKVSSLAACGSATLSGSSCCAASSRSQLAMNSCRLGGSGSRRSNPNGVKILVSASENCMRVENIGNGR